MISKIKKPVSILLVFMMIVSLFTIVPLSASAAVGDFVPESEYLTFTAVEAGSSVTLKVASCDYLQYNKNNSGWVYYSVGSLIALASAGDSVRFRGGNTKFNYGNHVSLTGKVACSGNVMSLRLDDDGGVQGLSDSCFSYMFMGCTGLTAAPELPETTLAEYCYFKMFYGCTNLTTAPELPATMLDYNCYSCMFYGCERLTTAPELPATTLEPYCYNNMFVGCASLTTAPELPATSLASYCYSYMFAGCEKLTTAPELPATTLVKGCYSNMFDGCSSIKLSETQTAEYSIQYSVPSGGYGTPASNALNSMFAGTGGTFKGTPEINTIYYRPAKKYTVTWQNEDGTTLETDTVEEGTTPTYDGTPEKAEDENYTYTFAGWSPEVVAATADATYTATYTATAKPKDLFPQHSITLGGNIGVNFYIDSAAADFASDENAYVKFTWDNGTYNKEVKLKDLTTDADGYYKATVDVVAAQMAHKIHAEVYLNGAKLEQTDDYSVQDYAETVYANPAAYDSEKPVQLAALAQALLNYGANAQTVFATSLNEHPALANKTVGNNGYADVTAEQIGAAIKGESADLNAVATQLGAKYYTSSLIYLSKNTLRIYFTTTTYPGTMPNAGAYTGSQSDYYYWVDHENIPAAELDEQKELKVGDYTFTFTALDYAKAVVDSGKMEPDQKNLAKSLYLYNQKANAYFDAAPAPVENVVDLGALTGDYEAQNNDVLTGVLSGDKKISIADGATITLRDANITLSSSAQYAGITPLGDAKIVLDGTNTVKGGYEDYPGVFVPVGKTLTIDGTGSLNASSNGYGCGIGGGFNIAAGNIVINGGTIIATGGELAAGIGSGRKSSCGNITITGGTVTATGGKYAAGIGSGAVAGASCGNITIANTVTSVTATKGGSAPNSIGAGYSGTCGTVTIEDGANVIQN